MTKPVLLTVATAWSVLVQVTVASGRGFPLSSLTVATSCCVSPMA